MRPKSNLRGVFISMSILTTAHGITLNSFSPAPSGVSTICSIIYSSTISGCSANDFVAPVTCSTSCQNGLESMQRNLQLLCASSTDSIPSGTLLSQILDGAILSSLCSSESTSSTVLSTPPTTTIKSTTSSSSAVETTTPSKTTATTASSSSMTSTFSSSTTTAAHVSPKSTSSSTGSSKSSSTTTSAATETSTLSPSVTQSSTATSTTTETSIPSSSTTTRSSATSTIGPTILKPENWANMSPQEQQILALANSGGGSPFDIVAASGSKISCGSVIVLSLIAMVLVG